jgi:hypothetical protein
MSDGSFHLNYYYSCATINAFAPKTGFTIKLSPTNLFSVNQPLVFEIVAFCRKLRFYLSVV